MSVGANIVLSSIIACNASEKFGYAGLIIAPLICGTIIGLINGVVYIKLHISSLIVTCALSLIYEAFSVYATNGKNVILSTSYRAFGDYPVNLILALIAYLLCAFILKYTKIGTYTYAIGSNEVVAKNMGVNVSKYKIVAFTLAGFFFGLQAILTISFGTSMTSASNLSSIKNGNVSAASIICPAVVLASLNTETFISSEASSTSFFFILSSYIFLLTESSPYKR